MLWQRRQQLFIILGLHKVYLHISSMWIRHRKRSSAVKPLDPYHESQSKTILAQWYIIEWGTRSISPLRGADRQPRYRTDYTLQMALWFVSYVYTTSTVIVIFYDVSVVIIYDVSLLLSMAYQFQRCSRKNWLHGYMGNKTDKPNLVSPSCGFRVPHCRTLLTRFFSVGFLAQVESGLSSVVQHLCWFGRYASKLKSCLPYPSLRAHDGYYLYEQLIYWQRRVSCMSQGMLTLSEAPSTTSLIGYYHLSVFGLLHLVHIL